MFIWDEGSFIWCGAGADGGAGACVQGASEQAAREALANAEKRILERKHQLESTQVIHCPR